MSYRYVGILLNAAMYRGVPRRKTGQESLSNYEEAAAEFGLIPVFIHIGDIHIRKGRTAAYIYQNHQYEQVSMPIPDVIHNRAIFQNNAAHPTIRVLISRGVEVFNVNNRYGKDVIHRLLSADPFLRDSLPDTAVFSYPALRRFMEIHHDLILKPCRGTVGRGIIRLRHDKSGWRITYPSSMRRPACIQHKLRRGELPPYVQQYLHRFPYLIQERIPLAESKGRSFDFRVTVQRGMTGEWAVTGMFAKKSPPGMFVSNLAGGGKACPVPELLAEVMPSSQTSVVIAQVEHLALTIASYLSMKLPLLADLGLDIGVTQDGRIYFIECNGRDQRYGFKKAGMGDIWKATYREPMAFAWHLHNRRE
ncbi:YheC/YheD family protein [Paenibacillus sp. YPG26]|uniref:YheC/YheD family endospore coat-associated protein n=1 Tax=Paenibacillus sp. YPG26 TaxID=2878915 RepID=UPI00203E204C|nr:YheC/YheD family protein [Paenibacillus sp. YPG26]USB32497.1 YheC/YheD family protein [Paenibacillus sp. YPG26]